MTEFLTDVDLKDFCSELIFNPFDSNGASRYIDSADPDLNCLKLTNNVSTTCEYYNVQQFNSFNDSIATSSCFSTCHWNARSLPKHFDDFTNYLSSLNHEFSIIALSETWLTDSIEMFYDIPLYKAVHNYRSLRVGGGVSIYAHNSLQYCVREDLAPPLKNIDVEALFIEITSCSFFGGRNQEKIKLSLDVFTGLLI